MSLLSTVTRRRRDRPRSLLDLLALAPVLALCAFMVWEARLFLVADLHLLEARWLIGAWASGNRPLTPGSWMRAYDATQASIATLPADATPRIQLGVLYQLASTLPKQPPAQKDAFTRQAAGQYRQAVALRPYDGWSWGSLAELLQTTEPGSPAAWEAWRQAQRHAPLEDAVRLALLRAAFTGWAQAPTEVRAWVNTAYDTGTPAQRLEIDQTALAWGAPTWRGPVVALAAPPAGQGASTPAAALAAVPAVPAASALPPAALAALEAEAAAQAATIDKARLPPLPPPVPAALPQP